MWQFEIWEATCIHIHRKFLSVINCAKLSTIYRVKIPVISVMFIAIDTRMHWISFNALMLLIEREERHRVYKKFCFNSPTDSARCAYGKSENERQLLLKQELMFSNFHAVSKCTGAVAFFVGAVINNNLAFNPRDLYYRRYKEIIIIIMRRTAHKYLWHIRLLEFDCL